MIASRAEVGITKNEAGVFCRARKKEMLKKEKKRKKKEYQKGIGVNLKELLMAKVKKI